MTSTVEVVNVGLRLIGAGRITSLDQGQPEAEAANDIFDELLDDILRSHLWNFATKRARLAQLSTTPTFGPDHAYAVPNDWLRTVSVHPDAETRARTVYHEELVDNTRAIVTSADEVYMRYIARITDFNLWSADLRRAFSLAIARDLAVPIASSNTLQEKYEKMAKSKLITAKSSDAMGSTPEQEPRGSWVANRGGARHTARPGTV